MPFDLATAKPVEPAGFDLASAQPVAPAQRSVGDSIKRQVGLTVRSAGPIGAGAALGAAAGAPFAGVGAIPGAAAGATAAAVTQLYDKLFGGNHIDALMDKMGVPRAENATERVVGDITGGMAGAGGVAKGGELMAKASTPLVRRIGEVLASRQGAQVTAGATGGGSAGVTRELGGGPVAQTAAGLAGGFVPALPAAAAAATRGLVRGSAAGRQRVADNIQTFEDAGAGTPTVGQATEARGARAVESVLSKTPGSAGRVAAKAEAEAAGLGAKVDETAASLTGPNADPARAGRRIRSGLEQFVEDFKGQSGKLYDDLDKHIPLTQRVDVSNTRATLDKINASIPGAPTVSRNFKNARIEGIKNDLRTDTETAAGVYDAMPAWQKQVLEQMPEVERTATLNGLIDGKLPYEALKKLRTLVGNEISDSTIASDVPRSKWKPFYAALSKDMGAAAREAGPKAEAAFVRANNFHRSGMQRLDDVIGPILKKGDPEDVFKAALSGSQEGASTIQGVMKSLPVESKKAVAATMLQRLGKANPSKQNELGEVFSTESFLTNWNKLHPDAKRSLFSTLTPEMRSDLDQVAKVASNAREGSKVFANPSGTAQAGAANLTAGAFALSVLTGQWHAAAGIAGGVALANGGARLMTSPGFVHWLAKSTQAPVEQVPAQLNQLFQASLYMKGDERKDARAFVKTAREALTAQRSQPTQ